MVRTIPVSRLHDRIHFAVITIRDDEFEAVLKRLSPRYPVIGGRQSYEYCNLRRPDGRDTHVTVVRAFDQGQSVAQLVARDVIDDLNPRWLILVGIAGGVPDNEYSIGDVLLASSLHDFSVSAAIEGDTPQLRPAGGQVHPTVAKLLAYLPAWRERLAHWNQEAAIDCQRPSLPIPDSLDDDCYYGSADSRRAVQNSLQSNFPDPANVRRPKFKDGALATSNVLLKDTTVLKEWKRAARHITHIEMEAGGVYLAARHGASHEIPLLSIRGLSDIVGLKRSPDWTPYACNVAASFFHALITELPLEQFDVPTTRWGRIRQNLLFRLPFTVVRLIDEIRSVYRSLTSHTSAREVQVESETPTLDEILRAFHATSSMLLTRIVAPDDRMLRPEVETLSEFISSDSEQRIVCLLGGPGSGKTSLLALLAQTAIDSAVPTFAIKADAIPADQSFDTWCRKELGLDISALDAVRAAATQSKVVVVIDQLDALSSTVDLKSGRLNSIVEFIQECSKVPDVKVVCSCRSFDYHQDARFASLNSFVIELKLPEWEQVSAQLEKNGIKNTSLWSEDFRSLLRTPQHLQVYLDRYKSTGATNAFASYQLMLDDLWNRLIESPAEQSLVYAITDHLIENEELWAPIVKFEGQKNVMQALVAKGVLQIQGLRVGFRHQTLLEHAKARLFTKDERSLTDYVLERQDAILVRPTVWAVLDYLREANPGKYRQEIETLFQSPLRLHLRYLLIDFLGQIAEPCEFEVSLMGKCLESESDRVRALISVRGRGKWFAVLHATYFPAVMRGSVTKQWPIIGIISDAWEDNLDTCLRLIEEHWLIDEEKDELTRRALTNLAKWDKRSKEIALTLIRRTKDGGDRLYWAESLVNVISASAPEMAPEIFVETMVRIEANSNADAEADNA